MLFGPLVTLMLLVYLLFLGVVLTLWFILSPGRKPDARENAQENAEQDEDEFWSQREKPTRAEERSAKRSARVYTGSSNDEVRGANARAEANRASETGKEKVETNRRAWNTRARTRTRDTRARGSETRDAGTRDRNTERGIEASDEGAKRTPAPSTATTKKRSSDAFEDFIRSKNDDFEF